LEQALQDIAAGKFVVVADDEDRENEGDLVCAAERVTPDMVNFMLEAKGMICLAMSNALADHLGLQPQVDDNTEAMTTAFTVSIDAAAKHGVTTGISASDRAKTIRVAVDASSTRADLRMPGHIHPACARWWCVATRRTHRGSR
jgi:3,4-dihydroxy 2-butanone 4-phosphate synthase/GTP cyclohydrolase II